MQKYLSTREIPKPNVASNEAESWDIVVHLKEEKSFRALETDGPRDRIPI